MKITENDLIFPKELKGISKTLYIYGNQKLLENKKISIVGTRKYSEYGKKMALNFSKKLSQEGYTIVSGLAEGTDSFAHIGGMLGKGKTIAILPSGFNKISQKTNQTLLEEILQNDGLVISEYSEDMEANSQSFKDRNRIVANISKGVVVVEGDYRTGTTVTVNYARKNNIPIFCIPGNIDNSKSYTPNQLIKQGAFLVTSEKDIIDVIENKKTKAKQRENKMQIENDIEIQYVEKTRKPRAKQDIGYQIYQYISENPIDINSLVQLSNLEISQINYEITMLLIEGYIEELPNKTYIINERKA